MITIVGMGIESGQLSLAGDRAIKSADLVVVKTRLTATYTYFEENNITNISLDDIFENAENFEDLDNKVVEFLLEEDKEKNICFCVDGSGWDDRAVALLLTKTNAKVLAGVSRGVVKSDMAKGLVSISCYELLGIVGWDYDTRMTLVVTDIDNAMIASELKIVLSNLVGEEQKVVFNGREIELYELDRQKDFGYDSYLKVSAVDTLDKKRFNMCDLYWIMRRLRGVDGCPWDKAQTHESIRKNMIEEAYELVEAINNNDLDNIIEETGDVLLQAVFHAVIGEDEGEYNWQDAMSGLCKKLIERHTHIFGDVVAHNQEEALQAWNDAKAKEKNTATITAKMKKIVGLPSLMQAYKTQKVASKVGMEFGSEQDVFDKVIEELEEVKSASEQNMEMELGDSIFALVNLCRWKGVDPEVALARANEKFVKRCEYIEIHCEDMSKMSSSQLDELWERAKLEDSQH